MQRTDLKNAEKIIVKVGTKVLVNNDKELNLDIIEDICSQIASLHKQNKQIVLVTSGAIAQGMKALNLSFRPKDLSLLQACASIGQPLLMRSYENIFSKYNLKVAQVLLTHQDLKDRKRHLNAKATLNTLIKKGVIPIINENDTVSVQELKFGDNDILASMVSMLLEAKVLLLLTQVDGFLIDNKVVSHIERLDDTILRHIESHKTGLSLGGMKSKINAALNMTHVGGVSLIVPGNRKNVILDTLNGEEIGTLVGCGILPKSMPSKKRWIMFYNHSQGSLIVDDGAKKALIENKKSLLFVGILDIFGHFTKGSIVEIKDTKENIIAKGLTPFSSLEIKNLLGQKFDLPCVHKDHLVLF